MQTSEPSSTSLGGDLPEFDNSTDPSGEVYCSSCGAALPSRNRLFAHLAAAHGLRRPDEVKAPKVAADDHLERGLQRETIEGLRFVMETRGEGRSPVRLDWVCTIPRVRQSLILWLRSKMLAGVLPQHAPRSGGWWKIAIVEFLKFMQDRSEIFEVGQLGGPQAPENGEGIRLRQTLVGLSDSAWQQTDQLQDESQEQLAGRVLTVLQAMQADPVKKRFSYQLLSEVAQDRGVQRLLHGRVLSKTLAGDARFEVKEDPRHGITIRLSGDSVVRKGTTDAGTSPSAASMVSILARHEGYAVALDKPAGLTTEELIHHFESQEKPEGPLKSVSRLDAPTSGALVVPLCQDAMEDLKDHFSARRVTKAYLALVLGEPPKHGQIDVKLRAVQSVDRYRAVVHPYGKEAVTSFQRLAVLQGDEHHDSYSLVLAWPLTGRMHQIRAHFAHLGFPLAGDVRYAPRKGSTAWSGERLFLHAAFISVPSSLTAVSPLKVDLLEPLKELKIDPQLLQQLQAPKFYLERAAKAASLSSSESSSASDDSDDEHLQSLLAKENVTAAQMHTNLGSRGERISFQIARPEVQRTFNASGYTAEAREFLSQLPLRRQDSEDTSEPEPEEATEEPEEAPEEAPDAHEDQEKELRDADGQDVQVAETTELIAQLQLDAVDTSAEGQTDYPEQYAIIDTNQLLEHLDAVNSILENIFGVNIIVPVVVLHELDRISKQSDSRATAARCARSFLERFISGKRCSAGHEASTISLQKMAESLSEPIRGVRGNNDDQILACAVYFATAVASQRTEVFTEDRGLSVKLRGRDVPTESVNACLTRGLGSRLA
ncbi:Uncharacterized RNA pseudouridine synthase Caur_0901 (RNA pseudouridylate synthase) (RNA-uridine isomerase) [Durusdinium trenchii]|uniref:Uncharacterized RNA pseudouridine synthase Caur_0901 (RNA pseudouridylate synthase) (RNA-uridine isomerase) n=1 Tax=Durusdinium trenchii TaxID=1381693 RepID=A0ABP0RDM7_9DINO